VGGDGKKTDEKRMRGGAGAKWKGREIQTQRGTSENRNNFQNYMPAGERLAREGEGEKVRGRGELGLCVSRQKKEKLDGGGGRNGPETKGE